MKRAKAPDNDDDGVEVINVDVEEYEEEEEDYADGEQGVADDELDDDEEDEAEWNDEGLALPKGAQKVFPTRRRPKKTAVADGTGDEEEDELFALGDYGHMQLLPDHEKRPLWITEEGHLFFEMFQGASYYDFIITIAEPIFRPLIIHEVRGRRRSILVVSFVRSIT